MDRPMGPRQLDKRNVAHESIFGGRPNASLHRPATSHSSTSLNYSHSVRAPPTIQTPYGHNEDQYASRYSAYDDRRISYAPSAHSATSTPSRQSHYSPVPSAHPQYPQNQHYYHASPHGTYSQPNLAPPSTHSRGRSISGSPHSSVGVIVPQPQESPDASLEAFTRQGLTPAQAYQAQVNLSSPVGRQADWSQYNASPVTSDYSQATPNPNHEYSPPPERSSSHISNGSLSSNSHRRSTPPQLAAVETDNGQLGIDFGGVNESLSQDHSTEDSELPWASATQRTPTFSNQPLRHSPSASVARSEKERTSMESDTTTTSIQSTSAQFRDLRINTTSATAQQHLTAPPLSSSSHTTRRSSESSRTKPYARSPRERGSPQDRARSMSASASQAKSLLDYTRSQQVPSVPSGSPGRSSPTSAVVTASRRPPLVYPALLSRVAEAFKARVTTSERIKDGLAYPDAFDGREAVDKIAYIIKTTDRNLALLLGRALDAQKFFHDVTYDHRLRDSPNELYQFRTSLASPFVSKEEVLEASTPVSASGRISRLPLSPGSSGSTSVAPSLSNSSANTYAQSNDSHLTAETNGTSLDSPTLVGTSTRRSMGGETPTRARSASVSSEYDIPLPSGVFTLLTDCYSPTCTRDTLCYSIACPRRLEQQARLNMKPQPGLKRSISKESLGEVNEAGTLWIHSVPQEIVDSVSDTEKKRQEAINEVIYTERDFVRDMEYLRDVWMKRLLTSDVIPEERRKDFIAQVFWNIHEIIAVNTRLRDALNKRQKHYAVVEGIGDILLEAVPNFEPFVKYGSHQLYGKFEFEKEKNSNPEFAKFVDEIERLPESRKLELNGYLTKPTTRLARYPLLLEVVLKYTPEDNPDKAALTQVVKIIRDFLTRVNVESGKTENRFNLLQLDQQLVFRHGEAVDLRLKDENRELVYKGSLRKRGGGNQGENGDLQVFLLDHALLLVKPKTRHDLFKVYRRPIPLELLLIQPVGDEPSPPTLRGAASRAKPSLMKRNSFNKNHPPAANGHRQDNRAGYGLTFIHLGRKGYSITLWAPTVVARKKWMEHIAKQQEIMRERSMIFECVTLSENFFVGPHKVNCASPFNGGRSLAYGTDDGVYFSDLRNTSQDPIKVLHLLDVTQVDILEEYQLLIVLSERSVITFPLEALDFSDPTAGLKRAKRVSSHTSFFKAGVCLGRTLVCVVKASALSSTIKTLEPIDQNVRGRSKPTFRKLLQGGNDTLRVFKEFYIPTESSSIHFLKTKLCVGCTKGFEIVDLESLDTQGLLDPSDHTLEFVQKKENVRPMAIYRIESEFLLCYDEFAFFVNKSGWRARKNWIVYWEGVPTAFALHYPYVLAFESTFVEIRHVENGSLVQIIPGNNLRCLFADTPPSTTNSAMQHMAGYPGQYGAPMQPPMLNAYGQPIGQVAPYGGRSSAYYGGAPVPYPRGHGHGRDEIILVSDDRVMALRLTEDPFADVRSPQR